MAKQKRRFHRRFTQRVMPFKPKTDGQRHISTRWLTHDLTFCIGPAARATYLAVAAAAEHA